MEKKNTYCFLSNEAKKFYRATQHPNGEYTITSNSQPYPITYNPSNLLNCEVEFGTNSKYFSMVRSINYPLDFIKDGAAILRDRYYNGKIIAEKIYLTIIEWNGIKNIHELSYFGRVQLSQKKEDRLSDKFTVPCVDDSAWGILSQNDTVEYSIDCSASNPKSIRVLIDGMTLINKYTFQTVQAPIIANTDGEGLGQFKTMPFVLVNQDGDSAGLAVQSQTSFPIAISGSGGGWHIVDKLSPGFFLLSQYETDVQITGRISFEWSSSYTHSGGGAICIMSNQKVYPTTSSYGFANVIADFSKGNLIPGKIYSYDFSFDFHLEADERYFLIIVLNDNNANKFTITPIVTNSFLTSKTTTQPVVVYGLRPLDYIRQLVAKATNNRFTINSDYFTINNRSIITSGDAIRQVPNAKIYGSFADFFQTFDAINFIANRSIKGDLFVEKAVEVYKPSGNIIDLGDIISLELEPAEDYYGNEIIVGSPKQDYRHPSGRLEFNSTNTFSLPFETINKKLSYVSKYRLGCFDVIFLILDYQGQSTQDNSGDKSVYLLDISDEKGFAIDNVETFENVTIDNAPLQPIIKFPLNNDTITYDKPLIKGIAPAGSNVSIFVDNVLDGSTVSDANGNWSYQIVNPLTPYELDVHTGIHIIDATFTDESAPKTTISLLIDTSYTTISLIIYPGDDSYLYNNKPLIKGTGQHGVSINVTIDGVSISTVVCDSSCKWEIQSPALSNGNHVISIGDDTSAIVVDNTVEYPIITYVGSELDGFPIINNLPLIKGVALPNTKFSLWLNYVSYASLGNVTADANGNWSFQVVPVNYQDPLTGITQILAPIPNGLNVISTSLQNYNVSVSETGYKLNRPNFDSITGVTDNTVFNVEFSPKRMLMNHAPMLKSIMMGQPNQSIYFQTADKNGTLSTLLDGVRISENTDVPVSSLGNPIALLEWANIKVESSKTFAKALYEFSNGGVIKGTFKGTDLYFLPIGTMKMPSIASNIQNWKLLISPLTTYTTLLNISNSGTLITLNKNTMYHSDRNTLHFVKYGYTNPAGIKYPDLYDEWFNNRNSAWTTNPTYIQKYESSDPLIKDQIIANGISNLSLKMYRCSDASLVDTMQYNPVSPAPINPPQIVFEAQINLSLYPVGQYFFILFSGETMVCISERIEIRTVWDKTILIRSSNSSNKVGFFYSTGIESIYRVEGLIKKWQPSITTIVANEESGDNELLYSQNARKRIIRYGTAYGLPDYLALKISNALTTDGLIVENVAYILDKDERMEPSDDIEGHPMYYYNVNVTSKFNANGAVYESGDSNENNSVILIVDAEAMGLPTGSLINIELKNE